MRARVATYLLALVLLFVVLFPVYQMFLVSLLPQRAILDSSIVPQKLSDLSFGNYVKAFTNGTISPQIYVNSLAVGLAATVIGTAVSALAGYALARYRFFGSRVMDRFILLAYVIPPILLVVPIYVLMVDWQLEDTLVSVILSHLVLAIPFGIWLLRGFFRDIPVDLDEAARVDGASRLGVLWRIVLPISLPGLAAVAVFIFLESWNEFLFASVLISSKASKTFPVGLYSVAGTYGDIRWGETMAAAVVGTIPVFMLFLLFQRWLVSGLTSGAVKG
jgi:ABC-type glycerol-3-phosphate transport system permease component